LKPPVEMRVEYMLPAAAERVAKRPGVRRIDGRTVSYEGNSVEECMSMLL